MASPPVMLPLDGHVPLSASTLTPMRYSSPAKLTASSKDPLLSHTSGGLNKVPASAAAVPHSSIGLSPESSTVSTTSCTLQPRSSVMSPPVTQIAGLSVPTLAPLSFTGNVSTQLVPPQFSLITHTDTNFISPSVMSSLGSPLISQVVPANLLGQVVSSQQSVPSQGNVLPVNTVIPPIGQVVYSVNTRPIAPPAYSASRSKINLTSSDLISKQQIDRILSLPSSQETSTITKVTTNQSDALSATQLQVLESAKIVAPVSEMKPTSAVILPQLIGPPVVKVDKKMTTLPVTNVIGVSQSATAVSTPSVQTLPPNLLGVQSIQQPKTGATVISDVSHSGTSAAPVLTSNAVLNITNIGSLNSNIINLQNILTPASISNPKVASGGIGAAPNSITLASPQPVMLAGMPLDSVIQLPQPLSQNVVNLDSIVNPSSLSSIPIVDVAPASSTTSSAVTSLATAALPVNGLQGRVINLGNIASVNPVTVASPVKPAAQVIDMILRSPDLLLQVPQASSEKKETSAAGSQSGNGVPASSKPTNEGHYCVFCNLMYADGCATHGRDGFHMPDTQILSRARQSFPKVLTLQTVEGDNATAVLGVFAVEKVPGRTRFGPLVGVVRSKEEVERGAVPFFWKLYDNGECSHLMECTDEQLSNWMMFMRSAKLNSMQNVVAYQQSQDIFYVTTRDILAGEELQFWFSRDYAKLLGVPEKPQDWFECGVCSKPFPTLHKVQSHMQYVHPDMSVRRWKCQVCTRAFTSSTKLNTHMLGHMGMKPHECAQCGKKFSDQSNLRMHLSIHTGEKRFKCVHCSKAFRQKAHLNSHLLTHTCEKKLSCLYCPKMFARVSDLRQHHFTHTKEKQYNCSWAGCQKSFYKLQSYKKHLKVHAGQKEHLCLKCGKLFATRYHLKRHLKACKKYQAEKEVEDTDDADEFPAEKMDDDPELMAKICLNEPEMESVKT